MSPSATRARSGRRRSCAATTARSSSGPARLSRTAPSSTAPRSSTRSSATTAWSGTWPISSAVWSRTVRWSGPGPSCCTVRSCSRGAAAGPPHLCPTAWRSPPARSRSAYRLACARVLRTRPTSPATRPATSRTERATGTSSDAWADDSAAGDLVDRRVAHVHDRAGVVGDHQEVEVDEPVALALEQTRDAAAGRDPVAVGHHAVVGDVAADMHPRAQADVGAEDPVGGQQQVPRVRGAGVPVEGKVLPDLVEERGGMLGVKRAFPRPERAERSEVVLCRRHAGGGQGSGGVLVERRWARSDGGQRGGRRRHYVVGGAGGGSERGQVERRDAYITARVGVDDDVVAVVAGA